MVSGQRGVNLGEQWKDRPQLEGVEGESSTRRHNRRTADMIADLASERTTFPLCIPVTCPQSAWQAAATHLP